jgi:hypothetical protein
MARIVWVLLLLLLMPTLAFANGESLYVRAVGGSYGSENGTSHANAWDGFLNIVYNAVNTAGQVDPGDTLYICGAHTAQQLEIYQDGTSPLPIDINFGCPGDPGSIVPTSQNYAVYIEASWIKVHGGTVGRGSLGTISIPTNGGITTDVSGVEIYNMTIGECLNTVSECLGFYGEDVNIHDNVFTDSKNDVIHGYGGKRATIKNNTFARIAIGSVDDGDGIHLSITTDGSLIEGNTIDHTDVDVKYCIVVSSAVTPGVTTIRNNTCLRRATDTVGSGIRADAGARIERNTITGGRYGVQCANATTVQCDIVGNLIRSASEAGVITGATTDVAKIINNTIIGTATGISVGVNNAGVQIRNNILQGLTTGIDKVPAGGAPIDTHNLFYQISGNNLIVNGTPTAPGTGSLLATNPLFVGSTDYRTQGASPVRRAGIPTSVRCIDVRGRRCWVPPDIGAYQATSGDPAGPRTLAADRTPAGARAPVAARAIRTP